MSFETYAEALTFTITRRIGGSEITNYFNAAEFYRFRFIAMDSGGVMIIRGDDLTEEQMETQNSLMTEMIQTRQLPGSWNYLLILYVFENGIPDHLRDRIPKITRRFLPGQVVFSGYANLSDGTADYYRSPRTTEINEKIKQVLQAYSEGNLTDMETYRESVEDELRDQKDFIRRVMANTPWGTWVLTGMCLLMFLWITMAGGSEKTFLLLRFGANSSTLVQHGEWWRLISSTFLHIGFMHLAMNMYVLIIIGILLERFVGNVKFLALYALAGIVGSTASIMTGTLTSAGASGAIFGLFGAALVLGYRFRKKIPSNFRNRLIIGLAVIILSSLFYGFTQSNTDNAAHLGGLITGILFGAFIRPEAVKKSPDNKEENEVIPENSENSPTPDTPHVRKHMKTPLTIAAILMILLALSPFLTEFYAAYRAVTMSTLDSFPKLTYHDPDGQFSFQYPAFLKLEQEGPIRYFTVPGMSIHVEAVPTDKIRTVSTIQTNNPMQLIKDLNIEVTNYRIKEIANRNWLVIDGYITSGNRILNTQFAFTVYRNNLYRIDMFSTEEDLVDAEIVVESIMETFEPAQP